MAGALHSEVCGGHEQAERTLMAESARVRHQVPSRVIIRCANAFKEAFDNEIDDEDIAMKAALLEFMMAIWEAGGAEQLDLFVEERLLDTFGD